MELFHPFFYFSFFLSPLSDDTWPSFKSKPRILLGIGRCFGSAIRFDFCLFYYVSVSLIKFGNIPKKRLGLFKNLTCFKFFFNQEINLGLGQRISYKRRGEIYESRLSFLVCLWCSAHHPWTQVYWPGSTRQCFRNATQSVSSSMTKSYSWFTLTGAFC